MSLPPWSKRELEIQQTNRQRRYARWEQVRELLKTGASDRELGRRLRLDHRTVKKFRKAEVYPEAAPRVRQSSVDAHAAYLDQRVQEGFTSYTRLWRGLRKLGFSGQVNSVRLLATSASQLLATGSWHSPTTTRLRASPRQILWFILKATALCKGDPREHLADSPAVRTLALLARDFFRIIREQDLPRLIPWIMEAKQTALTGFATRLKRDLKAAEAALKMHGAKGMWKVRYTG